MRELNTPQYPAFTEGSEVVSFASSTLRAMSRRPAGKASQLRFVAVVGMILALSIGCGLPPAAAGILGSFSAQTGEVRDLMAMNSTTMFAATQGGGLWKSTDTGLTWNKVGTFPARYV